jgi:hypothetical protein
MCNEQFANQIHSHTGIVGYRLEESKKKRAKVYARLLTRGARTDCAALAYDLRAQ